MAGRAASSAARSSGVPFLVFGMPATIASSDAATAPDSAAADPPPGVGAGELNASSSSMTVLSASMDSDSLLEDARNRGHVHAKQVDRRAFDHDRVELLAGFEAADARVAVE